MNSYGLLRASALWQLLQLQFALLVFPMLVHDAVLVTILPTCVSIKMIRHHAKTGKHHDKRGQEHTGVSSQLNWPIQFQADELA
jgi:hypothetical protein